MDCFGLVKNYIIGGQDDVTGLLYLWCGFHVVCLASGTQSTGMLLGDSSCPDGPLPAPDCCEDCWQPTPLTQMQSGPDLLHKTRLKLCKASWQSWTCILAYTVCKKSVHQMYFYAKNMSFFVFPVSVIKKIKLFLSETHQSVQQWPWAAWWDGRACRGPDGETAPAAPGRRMTARWCWASARAQTCFQKSSHLSLG